MADNGVKEIIFRLPDAVVPATSDAVTCMRPIGIVKVEKLLLKLTTTKTIMKTLMHLIKFSVFETYKVG